MLGKSFRIFHWFIYISEELLLIRSSLPSSPISMPVATQIKETGPPYWLSPQPLADDMAELRGQKGKLALPPRISMKSLPSTPSRSPWFTPTSRLTSLRKFSLQQWATVSSPSRRRSYSFLISPRTACGRCGSSVWYG